MTTEEFRKLIIDPFNCGAVLFIKVKEETGYCEGTGYFDNHNELYSTYYKIAKISQCINNAIIELTTEAINAGYGWIGHAPGLDDGKKYLSIDSDCIESIKGYYSKPPLKK